MVPKRRHASLMRRRAGKAAILGFSAGLALFFTAPAAFSQLTARTGHISVLLPTGAILVAGGAADNTGFASATSESELFLSSGSFAAVGPLNTARTQATGTLLPNGTVLVAGGINGSGPLASAEIYNPLTQSWTPTTSFPGGNDMTCGGACTNGPRFGHDATLLKNGLVLLCGGFSDVNYTAVGNCEIYTPSSHSFAAGPTLIEARGYATATLLTDGRVFMAGGFNPAASPSTYLNTTEIYTYPASSFSAAHSLNVERSSHTATLMGNGEVLIAGGYDGVDNQGSVGYIPDTEIYDPISDTLQTAAPMEERKSFQTATLMPNGSVQVFGGFGNIPFTQISAGAATIISGALSGSDLSSQYGTSGGISTETVTGGSATIPLSLQLGVQASGVIQNGLVIFSTPSITTADGLVHAYFISGSSNPLAGVYANLAGAQVTYSNGSYGTINANVNLTGLNNGYYDVPTLAVSPMNMNVSGTLNFTACSSATSPCNLTSGGSLSGSMTVTLPADFIGAHIESGTVTLSAGTITTSTSSLTLTFANGAIPSGTAVGSDGNGHGLATFNVTLGNLSGQVTLQSGNPVTSATMGGQYFPTSNLQNMGGNILGVFDAVNTTGGAFNFSASTIDVQEMFFGDNECYNPSQNTWAFCARPNAGTLFTGRFGQSATLLPNGNLVFLGGLTCSGASCATPASWAAVGGKSGIQYFNASFSGGPSMANARSNFTATLLGSGKVLVAGGSQGNAVLNQAEIYNPATNAFSPTALMETPRDYHTATLLVNGNVLAAGGFTSNGTSTGTTNTAEIYYPASGLWAPTSSMSAPRENQTATMLDNGDVLVAGGYNSNTLQYLNTAEIYYSTSATWAATGNMNYARGNHTATLLQNGDVLVVGGTNAGGLLSTAELYNPNTGTWAAAAPIPQAVNRHSATLLPDGKVLVAGGNSGSGETSAAYIYDPNINTWSPTGNLNTARYSHTATLLPNGRVLVAGGVQASNTILNSVELFSEDSQSWSNITTLTTPRAYHSAILTADGDVRVMGGSNGGSDQSSTELMYFTSIPDQESGTSQSLRLSSIAAVTPALFDRAAQFTVLGQHFEGNTEASGGGNGSLNSSFYAPRLVLDSLGSSGGGSSQGDSGFSIDLTTGIYANASNAWQNMDSSITVQAPLAPISLPYGWYAVRTISNAQYANAAIIQSGPAKPTAAPTAVYGSVVSSSTIVWNWTPPTGQFDGFDVYSATSGLFLSTIPANISSFTQNNLAPSATGQITVAAYTLSGDGPAGTSSILYSLPAPPQNLTISSVTANSISLSWGTNQNSAGTIYEISDSTDNFTNSFSTPISLGVGLTSNTVIITPLATNTTYYFRARAATIGGTFSTFSNIVSTQTRISVISVSGSPCASNGTTCIQWTWTSPGGGVNHYNVYNATAPGVVIATPTLTSFADSGLAINSARSIAVSAVTSQGEGPLSSPATAYTLAAVPGSVSPSIVVLDSGSFLGAWAPNGNPGGTQYEMRVFVGGSLIGTLSTSALNIVFNAVSPAASVFNAQVAAVNQAGVASPFLNIGSSATFAEAPSNLTVTGITATSISLSWNTGGNSSSATYQVDYSTDNFASSDVIALPFSSDFNGSSDTITGLASTLIYYARVQARNAFGQTTAFSNAVSTQPFNAGASTGTLGGILLPNAPNFLQGFLPNGMTISVNAPAGVVTSNVTVFISTMNFAVSPCPNAVNSTGFLIQTQPVIEPLKPYYMTVSYMPASIPFPADQISLMRIDAGGTCVPLVSAIDGVNHIVNATVNHFSEFVLAQQTPGGSAGGAKIFPNPFFPSRGNGYVTVSNAPAGARVRIFTLHGELVFDGNADDSGVAIWQGANRAGRPVASGIYLIAVEGSGSKHIFKLVVLR
ncbi:MAG: kelch repeat-containing protein [Elusimicrobiota bacterium]